MDDPVFTSREARRGALLRATGLLVTLVGSGLLLELYAPFLLDPAWLRAAIRSYGTLAPLVFVGVQTVQVVAAPVPGQLLGVVGGYLFGPLRGALYSIVGVTLGSYVVFRLSRHYGRPYVEDTVEPAVLERFDGFVSRGGVPALFVIFLLPTFPDDAVCFLAGLTDLRMRTLVALVVVGRFPSFLAVAYAGDSLAEADLVTFGVVSVVTLVVTVVVYAKRDWVIARFGRGGSAAE
jgi:uncharacterized membrane protein YdjX (TVP38/TMEM64 family)